MPIRHAVVIWLILLRQRRRHVDVDLFTPCCLYAILLCALLYSFATLMLLP